MPTEFSTIQTIERLKNQTSAWLKLFKESLIQAKQNCDIASEKNNEAEKALNDFVTENMLASKCPPIRMSIGDRLASLASLVVMEALLSLPPVVERQGGQLLLSFLYPLSVSIANAFIGVLTGLIGFYSIQHAKTNIIRVISIIGVFFSFGIIAWMNLAVARWREGNDTPITFATCLPNTAFSIVLLVIGIGVFTFAIYKGVKHFSIGFPGHDEKWDEHIRALFEYNAWKDRYLSQMHNMRLTSSEQLDHPSSTV